MDVGKKGVRAMARECYYYIQVGREGGREGGKEGGKGGREGGREGGRGEGKEDTILRLLSHPLFSSLPLSLFPALPSLSSHPPSSLISTTNSRDTFPLIHALPPSLPPSLPP
jgi:hypothetical protein